MASSPRLTSALAGRPWLSNLSVDQQEKILEYADLVLSWNKSLNLVGPRDSDTLLDELIVDSVYLAAFLQGLPLADSPLLWDPGAGAGLPGVPLRIVWHNGRYVMIESREKRAIFLVNAVARLQLERTSVFRGSLQAYWREQGVQGILPDCIVSRAFMPWRKLLLLVRPMLKETGHVVLMENMPPQCEDGWKLVASLSYRIGVAERWFWALVPTL